ncbi:hypothetical protein [Thermoflexibacter ruber]|uniref:Uncharacterized protein n=1 Tax=Thermoflexibacter ruber TaxID=1003 RepID=A0A1I2ACX1_9BACT|nr:hypothetical protein [Thermoflexibacter ruber]SFE41659.1 hypothetical protein SAMN04488541_1001117 [Thermoflexibacter ruber]
MEENLHEDNQHLPSWLEDIKIRTWEVELLISGFFLVALLQFSDYSEIIRYYVVSRYLDFIGATALALLIEFGAKGLLIGFLTHLILRGIWAGMIGLYAVYPQGMNQIYEQYTQQFKEHIKHNLSILDSIKRLEKLCRLLFSISFLYFLTILSFTIYALVALISISFVINIPYIGNIYAIIISSIGFLYLVDFLSLGDIKKIKWFSKVYYPIYLFMNYLTLSFLYKNIYYTLIGNIKKWKLLLIFISLMTISSFLFIFNRLGAGIGEGRKYLTYANFQEHEMDWRHYEDRFVDNGNASDKFIYRVSIPSYTVESDFLQIFIVHTIGFEDNMQEICKEQEKSIKKTTYERRKEYSHQNLDCLSQFYQVSVNDTLKNNLHWRYYENPKTKERGIITHINIKNLENKEHILKVKLAVQFKSASPYLAYIPFWKQEKS